MRNYHVKASVPRLTTVKCKIESFWLSFCLTEFERLLPVRIVKHQVNWSRYSAIGKMNSLKSSLVFNLFVDGGVWFVKHEIFIYIFMKTPERFPFCPLFMLFMLPNNISNIPNLISVCLISLTVRSCLDRSEGSTNCDNWGKGWHINCFNSQKKSEYKIYRVKIWILTVVY